MYYTLALVPLAFLIGLAIWHHMHNTNLAKSRATAERKGQYTPTQIQAFIDTNKFPIPKSVTGGLVASFVVLLSVGLFNSIFFYAEPSYKYHVRTILGDEKVVDDVGYNMYLFGKYEPWKKALSVVASDDASNSSANLGQSRVTFLDQVDSLVSATARFQLSSDPVKFLKMAQDYRTQENLLNTTLIPAFKETIRATGALMGAEDYFSGAQTQFNIDFADQLNGGLFIVRRKEVKVTSDVGNSTANATLGTNQENFGDDDKVVFEVQKVMESDGSARRKIQSYSALGITVVEARVTEVVPNIEFVQRMGLKQQASADRAIAREQRVQEEEQRLLAETRGEREVAEKQAASLVKQIEVTTDAETEKQLTLTNANREKEKAQIEQEQAVILLAKAKIDAEAKTVAADAKAYEKRIIIEADNALTQKLAAYVEVNNNYAKAFAVRQVPTTIFGATEGGAGTDSDVTNFLQLMTVKAAKDLDVDVSVAGAVDSK